jgi:rRNA maturation protein Nop10
MPEEISGKSDSDQQIDLKSQAKDKLIRRIRKNSRDLDAYVLLAKIVNEPRIKREILESALKIDPDHQEVQLLLHELARSSSRSASEDVDTKPTSNVKDAPQFSKKSSILKDRVSKATSPDRQNSNLGTTRCRACNHDVGLSAETCPNCGEPFPWLKANCPECGSNAFTIIKKPGFSLGKAAIGVALAGPIGVVGGLHKAKQLKLRCNNCQHTYLHPITNK